MTSTKDQGELPGVRPPHMKRLEEIEDDVDKIDEKISKLKKDRRKLSDEAVGIWEDHDLKSQGSRVRGSNEWYVDEGRKSYKRRRFKDSKEEAGAAPARKQRKEKASA
jgi:chorismate mutase